LMPAHAAHLYMKRSTANMVVADASTPPMSSLSSAGSTNPTSRRRRARTVGAKRTAGVLVLVEKSRPVTDSSTENVGRGAKANESTLLPDTRPLDTRHLSRGIISSPRSKGRAFRRLLRIDVESRQMGHAQSFCPIGLGVPGSGSGRTNRSAAASVGPNTSSASSK